MRVENNKLRNLPAGVKTSEAVDAQIASAEYPESVINAMTEIVNPSMTESECISIILFVVFRIYLV